MRYLKLLKNNEVIKIKEKKFEDQMVLVVVLMEILYGLRNGSIDWLRYREEGELIESDFLESVKEKLDLMFDSFLVYNYRLRRGSFDMCFSDQKEALEFAKGFMDHTRVFDAYKIVGSMDYEREDKIWAVRIYDNGENEKKDFIKEKIIIN
jgi:hypothetical protein